MPPTAESSTAVAGAEIEDLTIAYRRGGKLLDVVRDLTLSIAPGEVYGLVGESGCGKSTVAMAMMRYLPGNGVVRSGAIRVLGEDVLKADDDTLYRLRGDRIAMVYQDPGSALNPSLRIEPQISEILRLHRRLSAEAARERALEMLAKVQIADPERIAVRYPHELSGGQQQRVMIAMALCTDPAMLVLDEPTTGLDATVEAEVLDLIGALRAELSSSVLFISHNLAVVGQVCDRIGVLYAGRLVEDGPAREVLERARHPYTLGLLRCMPQPGADRRTRRLATIPGGLPPLGAEASGCVFAPRCPLEEERCTAQAPPPFATGAGRTSRCWRHEQVAGIPAPEADRAPGGAEVDGEPVLELDGLVKRYPTSRGDVAAVANVSLTIRRGEILGLVGESGSGKSSLAQCAVGLLEASEGAVRFEGTMLGRRSHRKDPALRRGLQMVFQNPDAAMNPQRQVGRTLALALKLLSDVPRAERTDTVLRLAESVRLGPEHLSVRPAALSGGLKQRAAIAAALAGSPRLVVCDEPVSALDVSVQAAILNLLVDLRDDRGLSYLFISHDLSVVRYLSDRIAVMYLGELVELGAARDVFTPPHHPYTEALASAIPSLERYSHRRRPRIRLRGTLPSPAEPPTGCRFHTRCPRFLGDICRTSLPPWQPRGDGHAYRCHIPPDELRDQQSADPLGAAEPHASAA